MKWQKVIWSQLFEISLIGKYVKETITRGKQTAVALNFI